MKQRSSQLTLSVASTNLEIPEGSKNSARAQKSRLMQGASQTLHRCHYYKHRPFDRNAFPPTLISMPKYNIPVFCPIRVIQNLLSSNSIQLKSQWHVTGADSTLSLDFVAYFANAGVSTACRRQQSAKKTGQQNKILILKTINPTAKKNKRRTGRNRIRDR